jgi:Tfp pilus assembly protein PilN
MSEQLTQDVSGAENSTSQTAPAPVRISWAPIAKVNLLPIEIMESRRFHRTQGLLGAAVFGVMLLVGVGTYIAQTGVSDANDELVASQADVSRLQGEKAKFAAVPQVIAQVNAAADARTLALGSDVLWYRYLNEMDGAQPSGIRMNKLTVTMNSSTTPAAAKDPLTPAGQGTVALEGTADHYADIASWLEALNKITGFSAATLINAAKDKETINYSLSAVVDSDALSGRYTKDAG